MTNPNFKYFRIHVRTDGIFKSLSRVYSFLLAVALSLLLSVTTTEISSAKGFSSLCNLKYQSQTTIDWVCRRIEKGETLENVFGEQWEDVARFNRIDRRHVSPGKYLKVPTQLSAIRDYTPMPRHYSPAEADAKFILVDLSEEFFGAYEYGTLVFSGPIAGGTKSNSTPVGEFRITAYRKMHKSSLYQMEKTTEYYPINYGLRFYIDREGVSYWIHGRDMPGYPASHGCIGLYDEAMQHEYYKYPEKPVLEDAKKLYEWVIPTPPDGNGLHELEDGPRILIVNQSLRLPVLISTGLPERPAGGIEDITNSEHVHHRYGRNQDTFLHLPYKRISQGQ
jgi:hypothetical protein